MQKKLQIICVGLVTLNLQLITHNSLSQNVGINGDGSSPETNTMVDIKSGGNTSATYGLKVKDSAGDTKMVVRSDGNVGVGTDTPGSRLEINGSTEFESSVIIDNIGSVANSNASRVDFRSNGVAIGTIRTVTGENLTSRMSFFTKNGGSFSQRMTIQSNGDVGIGTITPSSKLEVCGDTRVVGQINANSGNLNAGLTCSSDKRLKRNVKPISEALNKIENIEGKTYYWKTEKYKDRGFSDQLQYGFIAQELEEIMPELVLKGKDGFKSINYIEMIPILTEAIKEQQQVIENQKEEIETVKAKMLILDTENKALKTEAKQEKQELDQRLRLIEEHLKMANK